MGSCVFVCEEREHREPVLQRYRGHPGGVPPEPEDRAALRADQLRSRRQPRGQVMDRDRVNVGCHRGHTSHFSFMFVCMYVRMYDGNTLQKGDDENDNPLSQPLTKHY